jgi:branched-chain amino acid transport system ATP-binding protein
MPLLELNNIAVGYGGSIVLQDISIRLERGEIVALVGANGAGKSSLVKAISGLLKPRNGDVKFDGEVISHLGAGERLKRGIAHVPEGRQVFAGMTVADNLSLGAFSVADKTLVDQQRRHVSKLFPILQNRMDEVAGNFSGGQQQLLAIARGLMSRPRILLLDEPSLGVAPLLAAEIFAMICRLRDEGITILLAEQNARQALSIAGRGCVVENGAITMAGSARELLTSPDIASRYLGVGTATEVSRRESMRMAERLRGCVL